MHKVFQKVVFGSNWSGIVMADKDGSPMRGLGYGLEVGIGLGLGAAIGVWWDKHHASEPWGVLIGMFVGGAAGMYLLIKDAIKMNKE
jgi:putative F0F1-ATPase subunit (Ca2+/Mg2+ transporter)